MAPVVGLLLCAAACLAGEVAKPRLVRTPKQRPARVRITPAGDADAAPPAANASQDDARRRLRDRITNPPTSVPTITYSGVLEAPLILPPSGAVDAAVGITFLHELGPGVVVHCTTDGSEPDRWSTKYLSGGMIHPDGQHAVQHRPELSAAGHGLVARRAWPPRAERGSATASKEEEAAGATS